MIRGYTAEQVRAAEAPHLAAGEPLMARAAAGLAVMIEGLLPLTDPRVLLLVGSGDNGGDALFAGASLAADGVDVALIATGDRMHPEGLAAALAAGAHQEATDAAAGVAARSHVVVDGIVGTGTSADPALRGMARQVVGAVLPVVSGPGHPFVVAVDIPSGINPDDGGVPDPVVLPADLTVTFGGCKAGLLLSPARELAGRIEIVDVGIADDLAKVTPAVVVPAAHEP